MLLISKTIGWSALNQFKIRNIVYVKEPKTVILKFIKLQNVKVSTNCFSPNEIKLSLHYG